MGINVMTEPQSTGSKHKSVSADEDRQNHTLNNSQKYWTAFHRKTGKDRELNTINQHHLSCWFTE